MYRLTFTIFHNLNKPSGGIITNCCRCYNLNRYNPKYLNRVFPKLLGNVFTTTLGGRYSQYTNNANLEGAFFALGKAYKEQKRVYAFSVLKILEQPNIEIATSEQCLLLLQSCGQVIADRSPAVRASLCDEVWRKLEESNVSLELVHFNKYLEMCIENNVILDYSNFLSKMKTCPPNEETYRLLLQCTCQTGDIPQAIKIISDMKSKDLPADEKIFNELVLGNAIHGGLDEAKTVLNTMQIVHVLPSPVTYRHLLRGLAQRTNYNEFLQSLEMCTSGINEDEFFKLLRVLGLHGNHIWINEVVNKLGLPAFLNRSLLQLNLLYIHLIHMGQSDAALYYFNMFSVHHIKQEELAHQYAFIFAEMLISRMPVDKVIERIRSISEVDHTYIIQRITEVSLKKGLIDAVWDLFAEMPNLRPHYFWPILLKAGSNQREKGILTVIGKMSDFGVKPDLDTLEQYIIPYCDSSDPKNLLIRLKNVGFSYKELITPILTFLLKENRLDATQNLCTIHENIIAVPERLMKPLCKAWIKTRDSKSTVILLKHMLDISETIDHVGIFLIQLYRACNTSADHNHFLDLLKMIHDSHLKISSTSADSIFYYMKTLNANSELTNSTQKAVETLIDNSLNHISSSIPHPRNMSLNELENHLVELVSKGMETRGILRKLVQHHCRLGNETRVHELRRQFLDAGYTESAGMKASILQTYINKGDDINALKIYNEINVQHPTFLLDNFKIVDFATLLVQKNKFEVAVKLLTECRTKPGIPETVRNCWRLLSAVNEEEQVQNLFNILIKKSLCTPSNIILGPLVKVHIKNGNIKKAVQVYAELSQKYKCTPLQVELLLAVVDTEDEGLLQEVLIITAKVHGAVAASVALISTLSQAGLHSSLRKCLLEMLQIPQDDVIKLCDRWKQCNDVKALETLATAVFNFPRLKFDETVVYTYVIQAHGINNDCESAVNFYRKLLEVNARVPSNLTQELLRMVHRCNYIMSEDLLKDHVRS